MKNSESLNYPTWLNEALKNGQSVSQFKPERLPFVDQAIELAKLMSNTNTPSEIGAVLSVAAKCMEMYGTPVYIIKDKEND